MKLFNKLIKKKAFTLLEMLVVIGIIALLIGMGATSYSNVQKKARDTKRKTDLKNIQNALEQYYSICNFSYPTTLTIGDLPPTIQANIASGCNSDGPVFNLPEDPLGGFYQCVDTCNQLTYTICPKDLGGGKYLETEDCNSTNKSCCLSNLQ